MQRVIVRVARAGDVEALLALYHELAESRDSAAPAERAAAEMILAEMLEDRRRRLLVATVDGQVVGSADLLLVSNLTHHGRPWAMVENVVVASGMRRRGVGRALLEHSIEQARSTCCYKVQLLSGKQRTEAHRFYRTLSFDGVAEGFKIELED